MPYFTISCFTDDMLYIRHQNLSTRAVGFYTVPPLLHTVTM